MEAQGFWLRNNYLLEMDKHHIQYIIENPAAFGLTKEKVVEQYEQYGEKLGVEGRAREYLIKLVTKQGWIRIRHYTRPSDYWSIQCDVIQNRLPSIYCFVNAMIYEFGEISINDSLVIVGYEDGEQQTYGFIDGGAKSFLEKNIHLQKQVMKRKSYSSSYLLEIAKSKQI